MTLSFFITVIPDHDKPQPPGCLLGQVGNELYEFRDNSGSIYVDIGDKYWVGQSVSPNDKVRIEGEIDKDWNSVEVDVNKITVIK